MSAASSSDWRELARLGEQLLGATSLAAQRDCITAVSARLLGADAEVWLDEKLLRLPNATGPPLFSPEPASQAMSRVLKAHGLTVKQKKGLKNKGGSHSAWAGIPFIDHGTTLGALLLTRSNGPDFKKDELSLLEAIAGIGVVSLVASHRVAVERFRLDQLNLVREVSAQIANVLDLDELAKRVTELIQQTFQFYYVAIFTLRERSTPMRFRASAMSVHPKGKRKAKVALNVEIGEGLIGQAVEQGERIVVPDVRKDPRYRFIDALPERRSEVVLPLKIEDRVLGVLDVQSDKLNAFHPKDLLILEAPGHTIARAAEGARLYNSSKCERSSGLAQHSL